MNDAQRAVAFVGTLLAGGLLTLAAALDENASAAGRCGLAACSVGLTAAVLCLVFYGAER